MVLPQPLFGLGSRDGARSLPRWIARRIGVLLDGLTAERWVAKIMANARPWRGGWGPGLAERCIERPLQLVGVYRKVERARPPRALWALSQTRAHQIAVTQAGGLGQRAKVRVDVITRDQLEHARTARTERQIRQPRAMGADHGRRHREVPGGITCPQGIVNLEIALPE